MKIRRRPPRRPIDTIVLRTDTTDLAASSARVESYFVHGLGLNFDSPEGVKPVLLDLTRQQGPVVNRVLEGWLKLPMPKSTEPQALLEADMRYFLTRWKQADGVALLNATLARLVRENEAQEMLAEALLQVNRKASRHVQGFEAHNRSVQAAQEGARRKAARLRNAGKPRRKA